MVTNSVVIECLMANIQLAHSPFMWPMVCNPFINSFGVGFLCTSNVCVYVNAHVHVNAHVYVNAGPYIHACLYGACVCVPSVIYAS